ncbi:hypothetical protein HW561_19210 [Rhodobacteraceae bacterium B1Z28]|uniref:Uncharacterized protein n=1 Tax=Ruegeria haliotis TaxID=2747601 RepID=A0ABX2PXX4_9RHOB|nr:hypothetical protein [Ruegeria haliotis]NVO57932.1 hypothetical protein [Ruegeria haliotis]
MIKISFHAFVFILLTIISQVGGIAWLIALFFKRRALVFAATYTALSVTALWVAPMLGREPIPCISGEVLKMQSKMYCALNRQYVVPELYGVLTDFAATMESDYPDTETRVLDANFPYFTGFPLLPHLSHDDGRKVDLAFYYEGTDGYMPGVAKSPVGYFAFEQGPTDCAESTSTLRWDMAWLQGFWPDYRPEASRMKSALEWLGADDRVGKVFIEPHLKVRYEAKSPKIRFQGCRAARHDDHIHVQL